MESYNISFSAQWFQDLSTFLHVSEFHSFLRLNTVLLHGYTTFVYLFFCWQTSSCFHSLSVMSNFAVDICVHVFEEICLCGYPGNLRVELHNHMLTVWHIKGLAGFFQSSSSNLHSDQQCMDSLLSPHPPQHLLSVFFTVLILAGVKWYLIVIWFALLWQPSIFFSLSEPISSCVKLWHWRVFIFLICQIFL